jgi:hypothetical protein
VVDQQRAGLNTHSSKLFLPRMISETARRGAPEKAPADANGVRADVHS